MTARTEHDWHHIARLRTAHFGLRDHVRDVHGILAHGSTNNIERAHMQAHGDEGTPWHADAWRLPEPGEVLR